MAQSRDAARRLPASFALLRDGKITEFPMKIIAESAQCLSDQDAAEADRLIAASAPGLTPAQLRRLCARIVMMIDPDAARKRRETAAKEARVTRFQEYSGNAAISGRELPPDEVLAASQHIDATARALRAAGVPGTLQHLRSLVYLDLLQGTDPLARLTTPARHPGTADQPGTTAQPGTRPRKTSPARQPARYGDQPGTAGPDPARGSRSRKTRRALQAAAAGNATDRDAGCRTGRRRPRGTGTARTRASTRGAAQAAAARTAAGRPARAGGHRSGRSSTCWSRPARCSAGRRRPARSPASACSTRKPPAT